MRDQLGDHRIVKRRDIVARFDAAIDAKPFTLRKFERNQLAGRGQKAALGIFRVKPRFDGVAVERHLILRERKFFSRSDFELPFDEIEAGDGFSNGMLDLQPRVHFHEPERVFVQARRAVGDEFDGAGADITAGLGGGDGGRAHGGA